MNIPSPQPNVPLGVEVGPQPTPEAGQGSVVAQRLGELAAKYGDWADDHPYMATAIETTAVLAGRVAVRKIGQRFGVNLGNALTVTEERVEQVAERPLLYGAIQVGLVPVVEEFGARLIPGKIASALDARGKHTEATVVRHAVDVLFAAWHAGFVRPEIDAESSRPTMRLWRPGDNLSLPVSQYLAARNLRRIYARRGFKPAVLSHALNNGLNFGLGALEYARSGTTLVTALGDMSPIGASPK